MNGNFCSLNNVMNNLLLKFPTFGKENLFFWTKYLEEIGVDYKGASKLLSVLISQRHILDYDVSMDESLVLIRIQTNDESKINNFLNFFESISYDVSVSESEPTTLISQYYSDHSHISMDDTIEKYSLYKVDLSRDLFHDHIIKIINTDEIDVVEFGVHAGLSMKKWTSAFNALGNKFYGFDTFFGVQNKWVTKDSLGLKTVLPLSIMNLNGLAPDELGVLTDGRVVYVKGLVQETVEKAFKEMPNNKQRLYHLDLDIYGSTLYVLSHINSYFKNGDYVLFDEFFDPLNEWMAWNDFNRSHLFLSRWVPLAHNNEQMLFKIR